MLQRKAGQWWKALPESPLKIRKSDIPVTVLILAGTIGLAELMRILGVNNETLIMVYVLAMVVISRVTSGYLCGIIGALVSALAYDLFIAEPRLNFSFTIRSPITLVIMLAVSVLVSTLTLQIKGQAELAKERQHRAQLLYDMNQKLLAARNVKAIMQLTVEYLITHLGHAAVFYSGDPLLSGSAYCAQPVPEEDTGIFFSDIEQKRVHRIFQNNGEDTAEAFDDAEPEVHYIPLISKEQLLGLIGISCKVHTLRTGNYIFLRMLTGQVTLALELQYMSDEQSRSSIEAEKEKMRSTLLRAISHDLRTPLTSILGASSTILEQPELPDDRRNRLVGDIRENTQWLISMVENILTITRISQETMRVEKTLEAVEEVIAQAVSIIRGRFPDWQIHVRIPEEVLLIPMDATLISQVIINLLENAVKNSKPGSLILVSLSRHGKYARFDVTDNGRGIPPQVMENLFEIHSSDERAMDAMRGIGIGLSICQAIVRAHGGTIEGQNRAEGGARFSFLLPLSEEGKDS